ncbi:MAG: aldehyde dehydrogenase family protein [Elusimicrobia bacterium]|nr:aldehyde dehydrogenase family protein [Elusimicrobiota bacterium]
MLTATKPNTKVTYASADVDWGEFHRQFDSALQLVRGRMGLEYPIVIDGRAQKSTLPLIVDVSPIDSSWVLGRFTSATAQQADEAVLSSKKAQKAWGALPWPERVFVMRRAAEIMRERKFELGAVLSIEVGKSRIEAMGDAEESADLIEYYCQQVEDARGFVKPMNSTSPKEITRSVLRPYGVFACIAPFNFPLALAVGMTSAALVAGNAVVFKPTVEAPWTGYLIHEIYLAAGVPAACFNFVSGSGSVVGNALVAHPQSDGIVFTGSKDVGMTIMKRFSADFPKPCLMEMGGKNPAVVTASADLDLAAEGVMRSAFGFQGQKCSACSRVYVDQKVESAFLGKLLERTGKITIGDPSQKDIFFGPVINDKAVETFLKASSQAGADGTILTGGERLVQGNLSQGNFVAPTVVKLPLGHALFKKELFVPLVAVGAVTSLEQAIHECNGVEYGLTAGIYSQDKNDVERFLNEVEAGVLYANRRGGATTGAWPGVQSFCGWKGSGSTGKGGLGPYYVAQFLREQSHTIVE